MLAERSVPGIGLLARSDLFRRAHVSSVLETHMVVRPLDEATASHGDLRAGTVLRQNGERASEADHEFGAFTDNPPLRNFTPEMSNSCVPPSASTSLSVVSAASTTSFLLINVGFE